MSADLLSAAMAAARRSADERERGSSRAQVDQAARDRQPRGDAFLQALREPGTRVIAECKRRSPSRGVLRREYNAAAIAKRYEEAGAAAVSVLTEPAFFDGHLSHLEAVRAVVSLPLLRKDFVVTEFQVLEARAAGADAVLLIVGALDDRTLVRLNDKARALGLAALVEVHDDQELRRAIDAGTKLVGVNCRDLRTLAVNPVVFYEMASLVPEGIVTVAESGLKTVDEIARLQAAGYDAFLIGERFMSDADPGQALAELLTDAAALSGERR